MQRIEKNWGYEEIIHNEGYCMKLLVYTHPKSSSLHYHERKHECFYVASGVFLISIEGRNMIPGEAGQRVVIPPRTAHRVSCLEPGTIVEASSFDDPLDCVRLVQSDP